MNSAVQSVEKTVICRSFVFRVTVKELEFDAQHLIEAHTALVDVIVATATAIELAEG
jgi:hypothetical protein